MITPKVFPTVAIGAPFSEGEQVTAVLRNLSRAPAMAVIVTAAADLGEGSRAHAPLESSGFLPVRPALGDTPLEPGRVYLPGRGLGASLCGGALRVSGGHDRHRIDSFFRSASEEFKARAIGVLLAGTGGDGVLGLRSMRTAGGLTFAEPRAAAPEAEFVMPPEAIGRQLSLLVRQAVPDEAEMKKIITLLNAETALDFSAYAQGLLEVRIAARMAFQKFSAADRYLRFLKRHRAELRELAKELLVPVTGFPPLGIWHTLRTVVAPALLRERARTLPLRVWVPGCSTGEEAYAIAGCLLEFLAERHKTIPLQLLATDLDAGRIGLARAGVYSETACRNIPPEFLEAMLWRAEAGYQVKRAVREVCFFAKHDLAKDDPFQALDLISCRHVLMYMTPDTQARVLSRLHRALKPGGFLLLGEQERLPVENWFEPVEPGDGLYRKPEAVVSAPTRRLAGLPAGGLRYELHNEIDRILLAGYTPAALVVDRELAVIESRGNIEPYVQESEQGSRVLRPVVRDSFRKPIEDAIHSARQISPLPEGSPAMVSKEIGPVNMSVMPLADGDTPECFLVLFEAIQSPLARTDAELAVRGPAAAVAGEREIAELRRELQLTSECLGAVVAQQQAAQSAAASAQSQLRSLMALLDTLPPLVVLDQDLSIIRFTESAGRALNLSPSDIGSCILDQPLGFQSSLEEFLAPVIQEGCVQRLGVKDGSGRRWHLEAHASRRGGTCSAGVLLSFQQLD